MSKVMQVPSDWKIKKLGELTTIIGGGTPSRNIDEYWKQGTIPWVTVKDLHEKLYISDSEEKVTASGVANSSTNLIPANNIVTSTRMGIGRFYINSVDVTINQDMKALIPKKEIDTSFLLWSLLKYGKRLEPLGTGTTVKGILLSDLKGLELPVPPETEQHRTAEILSTLERAIEASEKLISKEKQIKKGLMNDLLTHGIDDQGRIRTPQTHRYQESELGMIPEGWEVSKVGDVISKIEQGWSPDCDSDVAGYTEWGVLKTSAVKWEGFTREENKRLPSQMQAKSEYQVQVGDLLMTRAGPNSRVGVVALVNYKPGLLMLSDKLYRLKPNNDIVNNVFLDLALSSNGTQYYLESYKTGLAESQTNISQAIVKKLLIVLPDISEQQRIAGIITAQDKKIEAEEANLAKLKELKKGLMDDLLSGRVRVKV